MSIRDFIFGPYSDAHGRDLPFTRWDIFCSALCGFVLLAACAFSAELKDGRTPVRLAAVVGSLVILAVVAQNRRVVFGGGFGILCGRLLLGAVFEPHHLIWLMLASVPSGTIAWLCLRELH